MVCKHIPEHPCIGLKACPTALSCEIFGDSIAEGRKGMAKNDIPRSQLSIHNDEMEGVDLVTMPTLKIRLEMSTSL